MRERKVLRSQTSLSKLQIIRFEASNLASFTLWLNLYTLKLGRRRARTSIYFTLGHPYKPRDINFTESATMVTDSRVLAIAVIAWQCQSITSKDLRPTAVILRTWKSPVSAAAEHETIDKFSSAGERHPSEGKIKDKKDEYLLMQTDLRGRVLKDGSDTGP
ncbi:hypothetical protein FF1_010559 [Malus domestica]